MKRDWLWIISIGMLLATSLACGLAIMLVVPEVPSAPSPQSVQGMYMMWATMYVTVLFMLAGIIRRTIGPDRMAIGLIDLGILVYVLSAVNIWTISHNSLFVESRTGLLDSVMMYLNNTQGVSIFGGIIYDLQLLLLPLLLFLYWMRWPNTRLAGRVGLGLALAMILGNTAFAAAGEIFGSQLDLQRMKIFTYLWWPAMLTLPCLMAVRRFNFIRWFTLAAFLALPVAAYIQSAPAQHVRYLHDPPSYSPAEAWLAVTFLLYACGLITHLGLLATLSRGHGWLRAAYFIAAGCMALIWTATSTRWFDVPVAKAVNDTSDQLQFSRSEAISWGSIVIFAGCAAALMLAHALDSATATAPSTTQLPSISKTPNEVASKPGTAD